MNTTRRRKWSSLLVLCLLLLLPLYVLSIGPTTMLVDAGLVQPRTAEAVYRPLNVASSCVGFRTAIESDMILWR